MDTSSASDSLSILPCWCRGGDHPRKTAHLHILIKKQSLNKSIYIYIRLQIYIYDYICIYVAEFKFAHHLKEIHVKTIHQFEWTHESVHLSRFGGSPAGGVAGAPNPKQKTHEARVPQVLTWIMPSFFSSNLMQKNEQQNQLSRHFLRKKSWFPSAKSAPCIALLPWHERLIINCPFRPHVIPWSMIFNSGFIPLRPGGYLHLLKHT